MGAASRRIAENRYDVRKVNTLLLEAMELNGGSAAPFIVSPNRGLGQRMVDILVASMAAVAAAPLMLLAAAAIAVCLGRPVLLSQPRPGRNGLPFSQSRRQYRAARVCHVAQI